MLPDGAPAPVVNSAPIAETAGALLLAYGVALALLHRERTGRAQAAEAALAGAAVALQAHRFIWLDGDAAPDLRPPRTILYRAYATADGFLTIAVIAERLWRRLCRALDLESLLTDPRYTPWARLNERQEELRETLEARFRMRTTEAWLKVLVDASVPAGRVQWGAAVFEHPQLAANGIVVRGRHPRAGAYRGMGFPLRLLATPARLRRHAPALGADSRAVLRELGLPRGEAARLVRAGAVRTT
jgi:formyl-CoA transferase